MCRFTIAEDGEAASFIAPLAQVALARRAPVRSRVARRRRSAERGMRSTLVALLCLCAGAATRRRRIAKEKLQTDGKPREKEGQDKEESSRKGKQQDKQQTSSGIVETTQSNRAAPPRSHQKRSAAIRRRLCQLARRRPTPLFTRIRHARLSRQRHAL
ncbi:MAG: hypothetical protein U1E25_09710 [Methylocystis sp.]